MRLTTYEILEASNGLPALVQVLLKRGEVKRALLLGKMAHQLGPEVQVFQANLQALTQAYGEMDRDQRQRVVNATSDGFDPYMEAYEALLEQEHPMNIEPFRVSAEELMALADNPVAAIAVESVVTVDEKANEVPDDGS
jgi:hypothetical protein